MNEQNSFEKFVANKTTTSSGASSASPFESFVAQKQNVPSVQQVKFRPETIKAIEEAERATSEAERLNRNILLRAIKPVNLVRATPQGVINAGKGVANFAKAVLQGGARAAGTIGVELVNRFAQGPDPDSVIGKLPSNNYIDTLRKRITPFEEETDVTQFLGPKISPIVFGKDEKIRTGAGAFKNLVGFAEEISGRNIDISKITPAQQSALGLVGAIGDIYTPGGSAKRKTVARLVNNYGDFIRGAKSSAEFERRLLIQMKSLDSGVAERAARLSEELRKSGINTKQFYTAVRRSNRAKADELADLRESMGFGDDTTPKATQSKEEVLKQVIPENPGVWDSVKNTAASTKKSVNKVLFPTKTLEGKAKEHIEWWIRTNKLADEEATDALISLNRERRNTKWVENGKINWKKAKNVIMTPEEALDAFTQYQKGVDPKQISQAAVRARQTFAKIYDEAVKTGIMLPRQENYIPQVYNQSVEEIKEAVARYMVDQGVDAQTIKAYLEDDIAYELSVDVANKIGMNPRFALDKVFPDYETAAKYGLTPRYNTFQELEAHGIRMLRQAQINRKFITKMVNAGLLIRTDEAVKNKPANFIPVNSVALNGMWGDPEVVKILNSMLGEENPYLKAGADFAKLGQEIALSAGVPGTALNFTATMYFMKQFAFATGELASGNLNYSKELYKSAFGTLVRSNFTGATLKYFDEAKQYVNPNGEKIDLLKEMVKDGVDISGRAGTLNNNANTLGDMLKIKDQLAGRKGILAKFGFIPKGAIKSFDVLMSKKVFNAMSTSYTVGLYKATYEQMLKEGLSSDAALRMAGEVTKNGMGMFEGLGRSKNVNNFLRTIFFAPRFRESLINTTWNVMRATGDIGLAGIGLAKTGKLRKLDPKLKATRSFMLGLVLMQAGFNALNKKINGYNMYENEEGRKDKLRIPLPDGRIVYVDTIPGMIAFPRNMYQGTKEMLTGSVQEGFMKYSTAFSIPLNLFNQIYNNSDYFGREIYSDLDPTREQWKDIARYIGMQTSNQFVEGMWLTSQILRGKSDKPLYEGLVMAAEAPARFSSLGKEATQAYFREDKRIKKVIRREKERMRPVLNQVIMLEELGRTDEAVAIVNGLSDQDYELYKELVRGYNISRSAKIKQNIFPVFEEVVRLSEEGNEEMAMRIINDMTDEEYKAYQSLVKSRENRLKKGIR